MLQQYNTCICKLHVIFAILNFFFLERVTSVRAMARRRKQRSLKGKGGSQKNIKKPQHPVAVMERLNLHNPVIQVTH